MLDSVIDLISGIASLACFLTGAVMVPFLRDTVLRDDKIYRMGICIAAGGMFVWAIHFAGYCMAFPIIATPVAGFGLMIWRMKAYKHFYGRGMLE